MNENNNVVEEKKSVAAWLIPIALLLCGGVFKVLALIIEMVSEAGGETHGLATVITVLDILPYIAWGLIIPSIIISIINAKKKK